MESLFSVLLSLPFMYFGFVILTFFWWKISRRFFIFLFYFPKHTLKFKKSTWQLIVFNYGIFGPLGLAAISGYLYVSLIFLKLFVF